VLADSDIREERATEYMKQILSGLQALHAADVVHRGLSLGHIYLAPKEPSSNPLSAGSAGSNGANGNANGGKVVKLARAAWLVRVLCMHRSNALSPALPPLPDVDADVPEGWLTRECIDSPLVYTKARDVHDAGMVMMQMLLGADVCRRFDEPRSALTICELPPFLFFQPGLWRADKGHPSVALGLHAEFRAFSPTTD
jgi:eukaryotic translation initiation factor 2-alpha kinase 4